MGRRLGQHFLKDSAAIKKIVAVLDLRPEDIVIEIGAGHGELTEPLTRRCEELGCRVIVVERDEKLGFRLQVLGDRENTEIIIGDVLKVLEPITYNLQTKTYKLVGNIPYYITGHLLRKISELEKKPEVCVFTIQKEVAERLAARPPKMNPVRGRESSSYTSSLRGRQRASASNGMNRLAACVQFWAKPEIVSYIPRGAFSPPPTVESAIIKLKVKNEKLKIKEEDYYKTVRRLFQQPRKTILNNLVAKKGEGLSREKVLKALEEAGIRPESRPQDLKIDQIIKIARKIETGPVATK